MLRLGQRTSHSVAVDRMGRNSSGDEVKVVPCRTDVVSAKDWMCDYGPRLEQLAQLWNFVPARAHILRRSTSLAGKM